jgi:hypothetical protein
MNEAARGFVHDYPTREPCIAEYGESFPAYLASGPGAERIPWCAGSANWNGFSATRRLRSSARRSRSKC